MLAGSPCLLVRPARLFALRALRRLGRPWRDLATTTVGRSDMRDEALFTREVNAYKGTMYRLAFGYLQNRADAEDAV